MGPFVGDAGADRQVGRHVGLIVLLNGPAFGVGGGRFKIPTAAARLHRNARAGQSGSQTGVGAAPTRDAVRIRVRLPTIHAGTAFASAVLSVIVAVARGCSRAAAVGPRTALYRALGTVIQAH